MNIKKDSIFKNGFVSSIPYIVSGVAINLSGMASDTLLKHTKLSRTLVRRIFTLVGQFGPVISIILLSFVDCTQVVWGVVLLTFSVGLEY